MNCEKYGDILDVMAVIEDSQAYLDRNMQNVGIKKRIMGPK